MKVDCCTVPMHFMWPEDSVCRLMSPAALDVAIKARKKGHNTDDLVILCQEIGNGELAVGVYPKDETDRESPLEGLGILLPWGFWYTSDGRVPQGVTTKGPPSDYRIPVDQPNIALVA
jgi:hypothetical protein